MDHLARLEALEADNERLRDRLLMLEESFGMTIETPVFLGLTQSEGRVFGALLKRDALTKIQIMAALYGHRPDGDEAEQKIVDVFVCKIRKKLKAYGIKIETIWGQGYRLTEEMKVKSAALIQQRAAA